MMRLAEAARFRVIAPVLLLAAAVAAGTAGALSASSTALTAAVGAGVVLVGMTVRKPVALAIIALLAVFASWRLGSTPLASGNRPGVSYSDAFLAAAAVLAVPALLRTRELSRLRVAGWGIAIYLACLLPTVLLNSPQRGALEWLHRLALLGGSLLVGAWIAREGKIRPALRLLTVAACLVAAATVVEALLHGWANSAPFGLNKNFVGQQLAGVLVVVFIARKHLDLHVGWWAAALVILGSGEIASHSRGGALAAAVGLFLAFVLTGRVHSRSTKVLAILAAATLGLFIYASVHTQLEATQKVLNNSSIGVRFNVERVTRNIWRTSPVYGVGLKYFNTHAFGVFAEPANNDIDNELAESGVIGLAGFVVVQGAALAAGFRRGRSEQLAAAGFGAVAGMLAHGMVDIYWTAGTVALPFIIMGMALAQEPPDQAGQPAPDSRSRQPAALPLADILTTEQSIGVAG